MFYNNKWYIDHNELIRIENNKAHRNKVVWTIISQKKEDT